MIHTPTRVYHIPAGTCVARFSREVMDACIANLRWVGCFTQNLSFRWNPSVHSQDEVARSMEEVTISLEAL